MSTSQQPPLIRVVDDDSAFRTAVCRLLQAAGFQVCEYSSAGEFLLAASDERPGCALLDLRMPGPSGLSLQAAIASSRNPLPVVFLTAHGEVHDSVRAMKGGAVDFLTKPVDRDTLLGAVRAALARDAERRAGEDDRRDLRERFEVLSSRECEVLRHVVAGRLNKQIAAAIGVSERTVKAHRARVMAKMRASSVADLVRAADRLGPALAPQESPAANPQRA